MPQRSILVIEDEDKLREFLREALITAGYAVVTAVNGREAGKALAREKFDLVLTDLLMPQMDGIEVIGLLRKSHPDMPVIAMSGGGRMPPEEYLAPAQGLGAKAILEKPFATSLLLGTITRCLPAEKT